MVYSDTLKIETLEKQFNVFLNIYNTLYDTYLDYVNSISNQKIDTDRDFLIAPDITNVSNSILETNPSKSADDCKNMCIANTSCKGATFFSPNKSCMLNKNSDLNIVFSPGNSAIVSKLKFLVYTLENTNKALLEINSQIQEETKKLTSYKNEGIDKQQKNSVKLDEIDKTLKKNKEDIEKKIRYYESLERDNSDSSLILKRNLTIYTLYVLVLVFVIIIAVMIFNKGSSSSQSQIGGGILKNSKWIYLLIVSLLFVFVYLHKKLDTYLLWGLTTLVIIYFLMNSKE